MKFAALLVTIVALLLFGAALGGCPQPLPPVPPGPGQADAALAEPCTAACQNLARLGCPEGLADNCATTCDRAQAARLTALRPECLAAAATQDEARACGTVLCVP